MRKHRQLHGILMYPGSLTQRGHEKTIFSSDYAVSKDFRKVYENYIAYMQIVAESAKIYILNNWKKVKDWGDLEISIVDNSGKETFYYNHKQKKPKLKTINSKGYSKLIEKFLSRRKKWHNPVKKISDMVLDTIDGDFSVKINGKWHNWIDKESAIVLADYIEKAINQPKNKTTSKQNR